MYDISAINSGVTMDYLLQENVCRLCWNKEGKIEIVNDENKLVYTNENQCLLNIIRDCLDIEITAGSQPNKLCSVCLKSVTKFSNFKKFCRETDKKLRTIFSKNGNMKQEYEITLKEEPIHREDFDAALPSSPLICNQDLALEDDVPLNKLNCLTYNKPKKTEEFKKKSNTFCTICLLELISEDNLLKHNSEKHTDAILNCFGCNAIFKTRIARSKHERLCDKLKGGFKCTLCEHLLKTRKEYERHLKTHKTYNVSSLKDVITCKRCKKSFQNKEQLQTHSCRLANTKKKYVCEHCGRVFARHDYLHKHRMTHTGSKRYQCPHCDFRTVQRSSLTIHIRKHTGERPYRCPQCPQRCVSSSNLVAHLRRHDPSSKMFQCKICDKKFGYKVSLEEHVNVSHELQSGNFSCRDCGSVYSRARGLRQHVKKKHGGKSVSLNCQSDSLKCQSDNGVVESVSGLVNSVSGVVESGNESCQSVK